MAMEICIPWYYKFAIIGDVLVVKIYFLEVRRRYGLLT
jgi:hypothetical protein